MVNDYLLEQWQDWIQGQLISVNYLNRLMALTAANSFPLVVPANYSVRYVQNTYSFSQTVDQLNTQMRNALTGARQDLSRVHTGMEHVPKHLQTISILVKEAPFDLLITELPKSSDDIERLVNESLLVLRKPVKEFGEVLSLLTEINDLLVINLNQQLISLQLQLRDLRSHWIAINTLMIELTKRAETTREHLLLQFSWVLQEFVRAGSSFPDSLRQFVISLLLPKMVEIDRTADLLGMISKTCSDISFQFSDEQIGSNGNLLLLEIQDRLRYFNQFRHDLPSEVVQIARLALKRHKDFLHRDQHREVDYETILTKTSNADLKN